MCAVWPHTGKLKVRCRQLPVTQPRANPVRQQQNLPEERGEAARAPRPDLPAGSVTWSGERDRDHRAPSWASTVSSSAPEAKSYSCSFPVCGRHEGAQPCSTPATPTAPADPVPLRSDPVTGHLGSGSTFCARHFLSEQVP